MNDKEKNNIPGSRPEMKKCVPWIYFIIFFSVLNESVFNVSTPSIAKQFNLDATGVSWVVTVFLIVLGVGMVIFGKLSDMISIKKLITIGIVLYIFGSLMGFSLQSWYPGILLARTIQGVGSSSIPALVFVMAARYFPSETRGKLFGVMTSIISFAVGIGPVIGGYITTSLNWSYLFLIPIPVLLALPFFLKLLPDVKDVNGKIDFIGAILLSVTVTTILLFATNGNWIYLFTAIIFLFFFIIRIHKVKEPFVEPSFFGNVQYRITILTGFLVFGSVMSIIFIIPLMLNHLYGLRSKDIGLIMFPGAISAVVFGRVAGELTLKRGSHFVVYAGLSMIALSLLVQSFVIGHLVWFISALLVLMYIGFSFVQTALAETVTQLLPVHQIGIGMGMFNMSATLAGAVVTATVAKLVESHLFVFPFPPLHKGYSYGNLIFLLGIVVALCMLVYYASFGRKSGVQSCEPA